MQESMLHELVRQYQAGGVSRGLIMERIAERIYASPRRFGFDDEDAAAEALDKYGRRIAALIDRFEDRGVAFDAYVASSLRFLARTIRRERRRAAEKEQVCERVEAGFPFAFHDIEEHSFLLDEADEEDGTRYHPLPPVATKRTLHKAELSAFADRLVFLALKCAWDIDDTLARKVAIASGVEIEWLEAALTQARRALETERCRYERLEARRNRSWCRLRLLEARLGLEPEGAQRRSILAAITREKGCLGRARAELAAFRPIVPNSVVARILGVPKGTVDSGLYYLKKRSGEDLRAETTPHDTP